MGEPAAAAQGCGVIRVQRRDGFYRNRLARYRVRIDGDPVAKIAEGETKDFLVPSGEHRVRLTIDRLWTSRVVTFQVRDGELAEFICRPGGPALLGVFWLAVLPRYIRLYGPTISTRI